MLPPHRLRIVANISEPSTNEAIEISEVSSDLYLSYEIVDVVSVVSVTLEGTSADAVRALKIWRLRVSGVKLFIPSRGSRNSKRSLDRECWTLLQLKAMALLLSLVQRNLMEPEKLVVFYAEISSKGFEHSIQTCNVFCLCC
ncbi:hypothetical protein Tco_0339894 [Tanacetum coccineum]